MPQFDLFTIFVQLTWSFAFFLTFYIICLRFFVVRISQVLKMRKKLKNIVSRRSTKRIPDTVHDLITRVGTVLYYRS